MDAPSTAALSIGAQDVQMPASGSSLLYIMHFAFLHSAVDAAVRRRVGSAWWAALFSMFCIPTNKSHL
jgi:hypothetical protein